MTHDSFDFGNFALFITGMTVSGGLGLMCMVLMETTTGETGRGITMGLKLHGK